MEALIRVRAIRLTTCERWLGELSLIIWKSSYIKTMFTWCLMLRQQLLNRIIVVYKIRLTKAFNWIRLHQVRGPHLKIRNLCNCPPRTNILPLKGPKLRLSPVVISRTVQAKERSFSIKQQLRLISYKRQKTLSAMFTCQVLRPQGSKSLQENLLFLLAKVRLGLLMQLMVLRTQDALVETTWMLLILDRTIKVKKGPS